MSADNDQLNPDDAHDCALYALKWMNLCRKFRLEPSCSTTELEYYVRKGAKS